MDEQNPNVAYQWCFLEKYVKGRICQWFKSFCPIYFQLYHQVLSFYKGILSYKAHRIIIASNIYYAKDFMKSSKRK